MIYATDKMLKSFQNVNLPTNKELNQYGIRMEAIQNYIINLGIQFYYIPCYDKQIIYPEKFIKNVNQYSNISKRELQIEYMKQMGLNIIDFKEDLLKNKQKYLLYGDWSDPTHWTPRGAYIGYFKIMNEISKANNGLKILKEKDYDLSKIKSGYNLNNNYYNFDIIEKFEIKNKTSEIKPNEILGELKDDYRHIVYENNTVNNDLKLLIIGDSYFGTFLIDDFAESFSSVALIWNEYLTLYYLNKTIDNYKPDIIILEDAQRVDIDARVINLAYDIVNTK